MLTSGRACRMSASTRRNGNLGSQNNLLGAVRIVAVEQRTMAQFLVGSFVFLVGKSTQGMCVEMLRPRPGTLCENRRPDHLARFSPVPAAFFIPPREWQVRALDLHDRSRNPLQDSNGGLGEVWYGCAIPLPPMGHSHAGSGQASFNSHPRRLRNEKDCSMSLLCSRH